MRAPRRPEIVMPDAAARAPDTRSSGGTISATHGTATSAARPVASHWTDQDRPADATRDTMAAESAIPTPTPANCTAERRLAPAAASRSRITDDAKTITSAL